MGTTCRNGHYYRFKNVATGTFLNQYAPGGDNVNLYTRDGSLDQIWLRSGDRLWPESNKNKCLDRYIGSGNFNNADVYTPDDPANQILQFTLSSASANGYKYRIRLSTGGYYLTAVGSDVRWTQNANADYSMWVAEELEKVVLPTGAVDYLAYWADVNDGNYLSYNADKISDLYETVFQSSGTGSQMYYNVYGALYMKQDIPSINGKFHTGVDFTKAENANVYSPVNGTVLNHSKNNYGTVAIEEDGTGLVWVCMHMKDPYPAIGSGVTAGVTKIGTVGRQGANGTTPYSPHLHIEVHENSVWNGDNYQENSYIHNGNSIPIQDW